MRPSDNPIWRPYTQEKTAAASLVLERAGGAFLFPRSGAPIYDGISSWWLITHGHCHPEIVEAVQKQAAQLDQVVFGNFTHEPAEELAELLTEATPPRLRRVFFSDNGSTAVEVALKMTLQACRQRGQEKKQKFLAFEGAYHGDTVGAMSVSGAGAFTRAYRECLFPVIRAKHPLRSDAPVEDYTRDFESLILEHHEALAAVIVEPLVQGAGGMVVWPEEALRKIAALCRRFGVLIIFDEVMTGFGRTGALFACERLGIEPDLLCLSKGLTGGMLPLSATLASEEIYQAFFHESRARMLFHGHSFTANPISCAAAVASLRIFKRGQFLSDARRLEKVNTEELHKLARIIPVSDPRICGTIAAFDSGNKQKNYLAPQLDFLTRNAMKRGLFLRPLGGTVYLMPPLCSSEAELRKAWWALKETLLELQETHVARASGVASGA